MLSYLALMKGEFWKTQPVGIGKDQGSIEVPSEPSNIRVRLPSGLRWIEPTDAPVIAKFLKDNYVEDLESPFRLSYSVEFFEYLLSDPTHLSYFSIGVADDNGMVGYLMGKKHDLCIGGQNVTTLSINFLCLSMKYRGSRLSPLLIKEARRIANTVGIYQGIFTGQKDYGFSIASIPYYHLPLDSQQLLALGFLERSYINSRDYKIREGTVLASDEDIFSIFKIYTQEFSKYKLHENFTPKTLIYAIKPRENVMYTIYNQRCNEFASAFIIDTYCSHSNTYFKAAYLYYWSGTHEIIDDLIYLVRDMGVVLFNVLDLGQNSLLINRYGMLEGTGCLNYHLFNW
ncbi:glycylpeptide N-tetradecanoyltransferase, partial [Pancytospora epiphaga]